MINRQTEPCERRVSEAASDGKRRTCNTRTTKQSQKLFNISVLWQSKAYRFRVWVDRGAVGNHARPGSNRICCELTMRGGGPGSRTQSGGLGVPLAPA